MHTTTATTTAAVPAPTGARRRLLAFAVGALALAGAAGACSSGTAVTDAAAGSSTTAAVASAPSTASAPAANGAPAASAPAVGNNSSSGNGSSSGGGQAATAPPVIVSFTTPESIDCHNGNSQTFSASWVTEHATKVTISIDGPGIYKEYPATGSDSLPFDCSTPHSFLLTAYGEDGQTATRSITLQPRNVQTPPTSGDEEL